MAIECGYALSRILTLYQDRFCRSVQEEDHDQHGVPTVPHQHLGSVDAISTLLVVVDAVQVVLEKLAAKRSNKSRRRLIVALETIKVALKLACLFQTRQMLLDRGRMVRPLLYFLHTYISFLLQCCMYNGSNRLTNAGDR